MDTSLESHLQDLYPRGREHDAPLADRLLRLRNMTPAAAGLIALLIRVQGSRNVLEIGTSNGYSAIWFADAVRDTGGHLVTVEVDGERVEQARANIAAAGVAEHVSVVHGDGGEVLAAAADASADLVVLDAERPAYVGYWPHLRRVLASRGVIAVDNAVSHRGQVEEFRKLPAADGDFAVRLIELGDGVLTAVRRR
ncbi:class I SAM-dependent methyltransferase [Nonomuraea sp. NPDC049784]|uniref:O-methyltransferase n=1 Tax=Nonomuraea sp. NPDC049784 TaxID=3154361 RepID=UPI003407F698